MNLTIAWAQPSVLTRAFTQTRRCGWSCGIAGGRRRSGLVPDWAGRGEPE